MMHSNETRYVLCFDGLWYPLVRLKCELKIGELVRQSEICLEQNPIDATHFKTKALAKYFANRIKQIYPTPELELRAINIITKEM